MHDGDLRNAGAPTCAPGWRSRGRRRRTSRPGRAGWRRPIRPGARTAACSRSAICCTRRCFLHAHRRDGAALDARCRWRTTMQRTPDDIADAGDARRRPGCPRRRRRRACASRRASTARGTARRGSSSSATRSRGSKLAARRESGRVWHSRRRAPSARAREIHRSAPASARGWRETLRSCGSIRLSMIGMNGSITHSPGAARQMRAAQAQAGGVAILPYRQCLQQEAWILPKQACICRPANALRSPQKHRL